MRQLGLGYANLGALLMSRGLPYDSDEGRAYAAAVTALMTGRAYRKSAELAGRMGAFADHEPNRQPMLRVIEKHRAAVANIEHRHTVPDDLVDRARHGGTTRWALAASTGTATHRPRCWRPRARSAS